LHHCYLFLWHYSSPHKLHVFVTLFIVPFLSFSFFECHCCLFSSLFITFLITPSLLITLSWCSNRLSNIVQ
jgi:hypothetical protein